MTTHYSSKHGLVSRRPEELYMTFCDMRNFSRLVPGKVEAEVTADYDNLQVTVRGFRIGVRVDERVPYGLIRLGSSDSPVEFVVVLHFDHAEEPGKTDFSIDIDANLNLMMRSMLGSKVQQGLDALVDGLVAASEGRMPEIPEDFRR